MASSSPPAHSPNVAQPYRLHISQRYLDLTKQKLELARLPREPRFFQSHVDFGVTKADIEPVIDHWLESYDWRAEEAAINDMLPQWRIPINGTRLHYAHKRSNMARMTPLMFVHGWPESFLGVSKIIDALCNPVTTAPSDDIMSFDVVAPSFPGFGFSESLSEEGNNMQMTADMLDGLMRVLGYQRYMLCGTGWGFRVCRAIALRHPNNVIGIHTANPEVPPPRQGLVYSPDDTAIQGLSMHSPHSPAFSPQGSPRRRSFRADRPQTISFALADSPAGLLAYICDLIKPPSPATGHSLPAHQRTFSMSTLHNPWTPTALINWTMMHWLPGPEIALRWLSNSSDISSTLWMVHSNVPLGVSHFQDPVYSPGDASPVGPIAITWAEAYHRLLFVRRREGRVNFAAWERPAEIVLDIREFASLLSRSM